MDQAQDRNVDVLVIGAGLAGLTAGATAARAGRTVAVLDVRSAGGRARSDEREGFIFNQGPRALYLKGPGAAVLSGLRLHPAGAPPSTSVFGWRSGSLGVLPTSAGSLARSHLVGARSKAKLARLLATFPRVDAGSLAHLSAAAWVSSIGLPDDGAAVLSTLMRVATYAPDLNAISADAAVRQLQLVQTGGVRYVHGGWTRLVDGLAAAARAAGAEIIEGERALAVEDPDSSGRSDVRTERRSWSAGAVVVAPGGPAAARALLPSAPGWQLDEDATAACLDLGLRRPPPHRVVFGLDQPLYLSTHAPSAELAPAGAAMVHVMRYGARTTEQDRADLCGFAEVAGVGKDDVVVERFLHKMVVSHSLPSPGAGLAGRPAVDGSGRAAVFLAGDWVGPEGLLADASLSSGAAAGRAAAATVPVRGAGASRRLAG